MKNLVVLCCLWLTSFASAQTGNAPQSAVDAGILKGRTYTNRLLGFSCEIPKDWMSFNELLDQSVSQKAAIERQRSLLRSRGVLLAAYDFPQEFRHLPLYFSDSTGLPSMGGITSKSLAIVAEQFPPEVAPDDLLRVLESELKRQKSLDPNVQSAPHQELVIDGQKLLQTTFVSAKNGRYTSLIVTSRGGYAVKFLLRSDSQKSLNKLLKVIDTLHFDNH